MATCCTGENGGHGLSMVINVTETDVIIQGAETHEHQQTSPSAKNLVPTGLHSGPWVSATKLYIKKQGSISIIYLNLVQIEKQKKYKRKKICTWLSHSEWKPQVPSSLSPSPKKTSGQENSFWQLSPVAAVAEIDLGGPFVPRCTYKIAYL